MSARAEMCLMDNIWEASHGDGDSSLEAAMAIAERFEGRDTPVAVGEKVEVDCGRCGASFILKRHLDPDLGDYMSVKFGEAGKEGRECDASEVRRARLSNMGKPKGRLELNLYPGKIAQKTGSEI